MYVAVFIQVEKKNKQNVSFPEGVSQASSDFLVTVCRIQTHIIKIEQNYFRWQESYYSFRWSYI